MSSVVLNQIKDKVSRLSREDQLRLIEQIASNLRGANEKEAFENGNLGKQLAKMANDPEIQNEIERIDREFSIADLDGLSGK